MTTGTGPLRQKARLLRREAARSIRHAANLLDDAGVIERDETPKQVADTLRTIARGVDVPATGMLSPQSAENEQGSDRER